MLERMGMLLCSIGVLNNAISAPDLADFYFIYYGQTDLACH